MPNGNGAELALRLKHQRPDLRVTFVSGYTTDILSKHVGLIPNAVILEKSISRDPLLLGVQKALTHI